MGRKKKEDVIKAKIIEDLRTQQIRCVINMKSNAEKLKKCSETVLIKIEREGISARYSSNHDCERFARALWSCSARLQCLKSIEDDLLGTFDPMRLREAITGKSKDGSSTK